MAFQLPARIKLPVAEDAAPTPDPATSTKGQPWTEAEHLSFLEGLNTFGKGKWRQISKVNLCRRKTPTQVASHAQKYFARQGGTTKRKSRFTVLEAAVHTQSSKHPSFPSSGATSGRPGPALSEDVSCNSENSLQPSQSSYGRPCRPLAYKPSPPQQAQLGALQAVMAMTHSGNPIGVMLPSTHSAFTSARPSAVMV